MRLDQLKYFVEVFNGKSINKTAEECFISQSAVSDSLKKLEEEVGVPLLNKSHTGVFATLAGQEFYPFAKEILSTWEKGLEQLEKYKTMTLPCDQKLIQIAISHGIGINFLQLLNKFTTAYPQTTIIVRERDFYECICNVANSQVDFSIVLAYEANIQDKKIIELIKNNDLLVKNILQTKATAIVSKNSPLASKKQLSISEMLKHRLAILNADTNHEWMEQLLSPYGNMSIGFITDNLPLHLKYIAENPHCVSLGSSLLEESIAQHQIKMLPLKEDLYINAFFISKKTNNANLQVYFSLAKDYFNYLNQKS